MTVRIAKVDAVILQDPKFSYFQFDGSFQNVVGRSTATAAWSASANAILLHSTGISVVLTDGLLPPTNVRFDIPFAQSRRSAFGQIRSRQLRAPFQPVPANAAVLESGRHAGETLSATIGGKRSLKAGLPFSQS
jgi:hypothetical protein